MNGPDISPAVRCGQLEDRSRASSVLRAELSLVAGAGALLAFLGPFGSYEMPPLSRLAYWLVLTLLAWSVYKAALLTARYSARVARISARSGEAVGLLIGTCAVASGVKAIISWLDPAAVLPFERLIVQTAVIGCLIYIPVRVATARRSTSGRAVAVPFDHGADEAPGAAFFRRLPPIFERELLCLEMEDHSVRVHSSGGSALLLMRMRDAVAELDGVDGARVGRSWWVRRDAVVRILRHNRAVLLELRNGQTVPVARSQVSRLRELGWLERRPAAAAGAINPVGLGGRGF